MDLVLDNEAEDIFDFLIGKQKTEITPEPPSFVPFQEEPAVVNQQKKLAVKGKLEILKEMAMEEPIMVVRFTSCRKYMLVGLGNGLIKIFSVSNEPDLEDINISCRIPCTDIAIIKPICPEDSHSKFAAVYSNGLITIWDYLKGSHKKPLLCWLEEDRNLSELNHILCCAISGNNKRIATAGDGSIIRILSIETGDLLMRCFPAKKPNVSYGKQMRVSSLKYDPRGCRDENYSHILYSASWDNCIYIWKDDCCSPLWRYSGIQINGVDAFDICVLTNEIVAGNWSPVKGILKVWKFSQQLISPEPGEILIDFTKPIAEYHQFPKHLPAKAYVALFTPDGKYILYGGWKENVFAIIDRATFKTIGSLRNLDSGILGADCANSVDDQNKMIIACITSNNIIVLGAPKAK